MRPQIFFVLDQDYGGSLDIDEISVFGEYMLGALWRFAPSVCSPHPSSRISRGEVCGLWH